jgi:hypothetical protein
VRHVARQDIGAMKRYKYQALVRLLPQEGSDQPAVLTGPACRMVVRAENHETHATRLYSALVSAIEDGVPGDPHVIVTVTVLGDDSGECLAAGEDFTLWRGSDIGQGVVTRRVFV